MTIAPPPSTTRQQSRHDLLDGEGFFLPGDRVQQRPLARRHRDLGEIFARRAVLMHVARGGQRVRADGQDWFVRGLVMIVFARTRRRAAHRTLRAAVRDDRDFAQSRFDRRLRMRDMRHERRAADDRAVEILRLDAQVLGQRHRPHAHLRRRHEEAVDIGQFQAGIVERAHGGLRHQIDRARMRRDQAEIGFRCADDCNTTAFTAAHFAPSAGVNTG